ncbi:hypothetical protein NFI96_023826, partial [Prochilodus magdalenae]
MLCSYEDTGLPTKDCQFFPDKNQPTNASIMYYQSIDSVTTFCHEGEHNTEAPNMQNQKCNSKATRTVIFQDSVDKNAFQILKPLQSPPPAPTFKVVQRRGQVICLILDVSGSMSGARILRLQQAATIFLREIVEDGAHVGIVKFSTNAEIVSSLTKIDGKASRDRLIGRLPTTPGGSTNMCTGLKLGIQVLQQDDNSAVGDNLIFLTDGEASDNVQGCLQSAVDSGAIINTIALGPSASDVLRTMAKQTGSNSRVRRRSRQSTEQSCYIKADRRRSRQSAEQSRYSEADRQRSRQSTEQSRYSEADRRRSRQSAEQSRYSEADRRRSRQSAEQSRYNGKFIVADENLISNQLVDAFSSFTLSDGDPTKQTIQLVSTGITTTGWFNGTVPIDRTVGNSTTFTVIYEKSAPTVYIQSPRGSMYGQTHITDNAATKTITLNIPGTAEPGDWKFSFFSKGSTAQTMTLTVTSRAARSNVPPVMVQAQMSQLTTDGSKPLTVYAEVSQNYRPVLGAKVLATLHSDTGHSVDLYLLDNGAGADSFKNDGTYSRYFTKLKNGRYSLKVQVVHHDGAISGSPSKHSGAMYVPGYMVNGKLQLNPKKPPVSVQPADVGSFTRAATGESFVVSVPQGVTPKFPPSKITDLKAEIQNDTLSLNWTAPGEDLDQGTEWQSIQNPNKAMSQFLKTQLGYHAAEAPDREEVSPVPGLTVSEAKQVWRNAAHPALQNKLKDLSWMAAHEILPVRAVMHSRGMATTSICPRPGCGEPEAVRHVLWECSVARDLWAMIGPLQCPSLPAGAVHTLVYRVAVNGVGQSMKRMPAEEFAMLWLTLNCVKAALWTARNLLVGKRVTVPLHAIYQMVRDIPQPEPAPTAGASSTSTAPAASGTSTSTAPPTSSSTITGPAPATFATPPGETGVSVLLECFEISERHTADNLSEQLLRVAREWGQDKVAACVSDNAANVVKAIQKTGWPHLFCFAHTLNPIVNSGIAAIKQTVEKVKAIVEYVHRSTVATENLKAAQKQLGLAESRLKQDCPTRWNSTYYMMLRFLENNDAIITTLALTNPRLAALTPDEWEEMKQACDVLKPFEEVTVEISGEGYVTALKVILLARAALDPRFKKKAFGKEEDADRAYQQLCNAAARVTLPNQQAEGEEAAQGAAAGESSTQESAIWKDFDQQVSGLVTSNRNPTADSVLEVRAFVEEPLVKRSSNPLTWWQSRGVVYPRLYEMMVKRLCIVATSVPSERVGQIISEQRNRLSSAKAHLHGKGLPGMSLHDCNIFLSLPVHQIYHMLSIYGTSWDTRTTPPACDSDASLLNHFYARFETQNGMAARKTSPPLNDQVLCLTAADVRKRELTHGKPLDQTTFLRVSRQPPSYPCRRSLQCPASTTTVPLHLHPSSWKCFERLFMRHIKTLLPPSLDPLQFAYRPNRTTDDAISTTPHLVLTHLDNRDTYVRMLFIDFSSAINTIIPQHLIGKLNLLGRTAEKIIGVSLPTITDIYTTRCIHKANSIVGDHTHPSHTLFTLLPSGK